jgi:sugar/nucleoside kinase (ribokinase family)
MASKVQVLGIGNAIVDVLSHVEEPFLKRLDAAKSSMVLIDQVRAQQIYSMIGPATEMSGGSVANSIAGVANLGGGTAYIGCVADDQLGGIFNHDMKSLGVDIRLPPRTGGAPTACCYVLITPDGERTMQTYLGACTELGPEDVTAQTLGRPKVVLLEGYLWDIPQGPAALTRAMRMAREQDTVVAMSLSDAECVSRHLSEYQASLAQYAGLVFANEREIMRLLDTTTFDAAVTAAKQHEAIFVLTRSEKGSVIVTREETIVQPAIPIKKLVDATGAGDAYTAGFLYAWTAGRALKDCAELGARCASSVIQQVGARLERDFLRATD